MSIDEMFSQADARVRTKIERQAAAAHLRIRAATECEIRDGDREPIEVEVTRAMQDVAAQYAAACQRFSASLAYAARAFANFYDADHQQFQRRRA